MGCFDFYFLLCSGWMGQSIHFRSDNLAVVEALASRSARDVTLSHLLCCLVFLEAHYRFEHTVSHIPGVLNRAADVLSRNNLPTFLSVFPQAHPSSSTGTTAAAVDAIGYDPVLDLTALDRAIHQYFAEGIAWSMADSYGSAKCRYLDFCNSAGVPPLPVTELSACRFIVYLAMQGLKAQSIAVYLSALRHLQVSAGLPGLERSEWPRLSYVLQGIKCSQRGLPGRTRLPISGAIMQSLHSFCSLDSQVEV